MARRDGYSRGLESLEEIRASDRFIEQLRVSGTYEPSTRADAALAAALLTWRDEARMEPLNPPPSADEVDIDGYAQPRRIARRAVAAAAAMLALSSAAATALDGDPLKPVRFLVDLGVNVGERIGHPSSESSSGESPVEILPVSDDDIPFLPPWVDESGSSAKPGGHPSVEATDPKEAETEGGDPGTPEPTEPVIEPAEPPATDDGDTTIDDAGEPTDPATSEPTDPTSDPTDDSTSDPTDPPTSDPTDPPTSDPTDPTTNEGENPEGGADNPGGLDEGTNPDPAPAPEENKADDGPTPPASSEDTRSDQDGTAGADTRRLSVEKTGGAGDADTDSDANGHIDANGTGAVGPNGVAWAWGHDRRGPPPWAGDGFQEFSNHNTFPSMWTPWLWPRLR